jgi:hypothetical protein
MQVPGVAVVEAVQGHEGFGIGFISTSTAAFETLGGRLALGFVGTTADLPAATAELGEANRFLPLGHIAQELIGSPPPVGLERTLRVLLWDFSCDEFEA